MKVSKDYGLLGVPGPGLLEISVLTGAGLTLWRGTTRLFESLSFTLVPGAALLIEGPNGAGKTTLLRVIAGLTMPESGSVAWQGLPLREQLNAARLRLVFTGHALALKTELSTRENLQFFARLAGLDGRVDEILEATGLGACADLEVRLLSAGQRRRAALARVLLSDADLWLLDEPQTNLDADGRQFLEEAIRSHLRRGGMAAIAAHQPLALGNADVGHLVLGDA
jgi:heme exporter protein A